MSFSDIMDRLIKLAERKEVRRRALFEDIVEPCHGLMVQIFKDYRTTFRRILDEYASNPDATAQTIRTDIARSRDKLFEERAEAIAMATARASSAQPQLSAFGTAIRDAFHGVGVVDDEDHYVGTPYSATARLIQSVEIEGQPATLYFGMIEKSLDKLEQELRAVNSAYAAAKLSLLS